MSAADLIRQGFRDEPNVEQFVRKYEEWESLVLNLRSQLDQREAQLREQEAEPGPTPLRSQMADDERLYREELRELRRLVLTAILYPVRGDGETLATVLEEALRGVEVESGTLADGPVDLVDVDLVSLAATVTRWQLSRA